METNQQACSHLAEKVNTLINSSLTGAKEISVKIHQRKLAVGAEKTPIFLLNAVRSTEALLKTLKRVVVVVVVVGRRTLS